MLKHPDQEVQFLVEMLEGQRDQAVAQAAALFRANKELEAKLKEAQENAENKAKDQECGETLNPGCTD
jgi:hypothetical protein